MEESGEMPLEDIAGALELDYTRTRRRLVLCCVFEFTIILLQWKLGGDRFVTLYIEETA